MAARGSAGRIGAGALGAVVIVLGCGRSVEHAGTGGSAAVGEAGAAAARGGEGNAGGFGDGAGGATSGSSGRAGGGAGGSAGSASQASGGSGNAAGSAASGGGGAGGMAGSRANAGSGGLAGDDCKAIEQEAQAAADTSCTQDGDCELAPYTMGDCSECGFVTNVASEQSSIEATHAVCERFYAQGCQVPRHSCPAHTPTCVAGVCE